MRCDLRLLNAGQNLVWFCSSDVLILWKCQSIHSMKLFLRFIQQRLFVVQIISTWMTEYSGPVPVELPINTKKIGLYLLYPLSIVLWNSFSSLWCWHFWNDEKYVKLILFACYQSFFLRQLSCTQLHTVKSNWVLSGLDIDLKIKKTEFFRCFFLGQWKKCCFCCYRHI